MAPMRSAASDIGRESALHCVVPYVSAAASSSVDLDPTWSVLLLPSTGRQTATHGVGSTANWRLPPNGRFDPAVSYCSSQRSELNAMIANRMQCYFVRRLTAYP